VEDPEIRILSVEEMSQTKCLYCGELVPANADPCPSCLHRRGRGAIHKPALQRTLRDLAMEGHFRAAGLWCLISAGLAGIVGAAVLLAIPVVHLQLGGFRKGEGGIIAVSALVALGLSAGLYFLGRGLSRFSNTARLVSGVLNILLAVLGFVAGLSVLLLDKGPAGGALLGLVVDLAVILPYVWLSFHARAAHVCSPSYRKSIENDSRKGLIVGSPFFWIPIAHAGVRILLAALFLAAGGDGARPPDSDPRPAEAPFDRGWR